MIISCFHDPRGNTFFDALRRISLDAGASRLYYHAECGNDVKFVN
jgi:hypothetical protein